MGVHYNTHTHTRLMALCLGLPGSASTRKVKPIWILLKQETVSGSGISWAICKSATRSRQIITPAPHHSVFYRQARCRSCHPTNSVKALKGVHYNKVWNVWLIKESKWLLLKGMFLCARIVSHNCWWNADNGGDFSVKDNGGDFSMNGPLCTNNTFTYSTTQSSLLK